LKAASAGNIVSIFNQGCDYQHFFISISKGFPSKSSGPRVIGSGDKKKLENSPVSSPVPFRNGNISTANSNAQAASAADNLPKAKHSSDFNGTHHSSEMNLLDSSNDISVLESSMMSTDFRLNTTAKSHGKRQSSSRVALGMVSREDDTHIAPKNSNKAPEMYYPIAETVQTNQVHRVSFTDRVTINTTTNNSESKGTGGNYAGAEVQELKAALAQAIHEKEETDRHRVIELEQMKARLSDSSRSEKQVAHKEEQAVIVQSTLTQLHDHLEHQRIVTQLELEIIRLKDEANIKAMKHQEELKYYKDRFQVEVEELKMKNENEIELIEKRHAERFIMF